ncbi:MAG TPA: helix-turn-helix transcriptional regulator, partial [Acidimicrobiales bacterium]|nr:helix-turn-helix transcriptional regulator [Acidimicrobiales bacterium]
RSHPGVLLYTERPAGNDRTDLRSLGLSAREAEIVSLVLAGATNAGVAATLHIAVGTVKKHLDNVYCKLGVHGRGPLTALVLGHWSDGPWASGSG